MKKQGTLITGDEVTFHADPARKDIVFPLGLTYEEGYEILERMHIASETVEQLEPVSYPNRPNDVAVAVARVIHRMFGVAIGRATQTMFGENPPTFKSVPVSLTERIEVATGPIGLPSLEKATIIVGETRDKELGVVGSISATMKRRDRPIVAKFLAEVQKELKDNSIYQGKALKVTRDAVEPSFMDISSFPTLETIVYSDEAMAALEGSVLYRLRYREILAEEGVSFKASTLLYGPYGTGKSSFGQISAREAIANGVTVIFADAGADVEDLLRTGRLYGPSLVFVEDIDTYASSGEADQVTKFLDAFDGITAKAGNVMVIMTTNNINNIHKGFLRPGRVDACVEISYLDRQGLEKLMRANIDPKKLAADVDFDPVFAVSEKYTPSFIGQVVKVAKIHALGRVGGKHNNYVLTTKDLVNAATQLKGHHELMEAAGEGQRTPTLDRVIKDTLLEAAEEGANRANDGTELRRGDSSLGTLVKEES
jgi:transitional endoplasmic reticulum ATPase